MDKEIKYLKTTEIKALREKLHLEQDGICPICVTKLSADFIPFINNYIIKILNKQGTTDGKVYK